MLLKVLFLYLLSLLLKLFGFVVTGYLVLLADAMHSVTDIATIALLVYSAKVSLKPPDLSHPLGHELARNVASLVAATAFITVVAFELFKEGVSSILSPKTSYGDPFLAIVIEAFVLAILLLAVLVSSRGKGVLDKTVFVESVNDSLSTIAAIAGIFLVSRGYPVFDGVVTILIASMIFYNSLKLFKQNARFLLGFSPPDEFYRKVKDVSLTFREVKGVHDMVAVYMGENNIHLDMHITVDGNMSIEKADELSERLAKKLREEIPEVKHVVIHICPHVGESMRKIL